MKTVPDYAGEILQELGGILHRIDPGSTQQLVQEILAAKRIYVAGAGRSLLMIRSFGMRLMHLGFTAYVVGETVTPALQPGDLVIFGSGSGETGALKIMGQKAKDIGARVALITYSPNSTLGHLADCVVALPLPTGAAKLQPSGSSFEQAMLLLCDALVLALLDTGQFKRQDQDVDMFIKIRHANME